MRDQVMRALALGCLVLVAPVGTVAQAPAPPAFEVASVRLSAPGTIASQQLLDTRATLIRQSLRSVLLLAFRVKDYQLSAPDWLQEVQIDVQATLPAGATRQHVPEMLQRVLAQRFGLVVRRELRPLDAYELTVDPAGARKMQEVEPANELDRAFPIGTFPSPEARASADRLEETLTGPVRTVRGNREVTTVTARSMYSLKMSDQGKPMYVLSAARMTMSDLATVLERLIGQPVFDRTNLTGVYTFNIELPPSNATRDSVLRNRGGSVTNLQEGFAVPPAVLSSEALKGLGLRLERRRAEIETIVVDRIERTPTDN
jgi:uncharacterized protein (TIGR03435 family)